MPKFSITIILLFSLAQVRAQRVGLGSVVKKEGIGILLINWKIAADTSVKQLPADSRLWNIEGSYPYICLEQNENGYLIKYIHRLYPVADSTVFYLKPKHRKAARLLTWDSYWNKVLEDIYDKQKKYKSRLFVSRADTTKYIIRTAPDDMAPSVLCQNFLYSCLVVSAVKGDWLKVSVSLFDDCSEWFVNEEISAHPDLYQYDGTQEEQKHFERVYRQIIFKKCFKNGWIRWKSDDACYLLSLFYGDT